MTWLLSRPAWQLRIAGLVLAAGIALGWLHHWESSLRDDGAQTVRDSLASSTALRWHRTVDTLSRQADTQTVTLTRILRRTDTLLRQVPETIVTHADTVRAIQGLPALRLATDSAIRACSEYQSLFTRYRTACDSLHHADQAQIDGLNARIKKQVRDGRIDAAKNLGLAAGIACLAYSVGAHKPCWRL